VKTRMPQLSDWVLVLLWCVAMHVVLGGSPCLTSFLLPWHCDPSAFEPFERAPVAAVIACSLVLDAALPRVYHRLWRIDVRTYNLAFAAFSASCIVLLATVPAIGLPTFLYSKVAEFVDTAVVLQRSAGRRSTLQWLHHLTTPIMMGLTGLYAPRDVYVMAVANSIVHTAMYAYFAGLVPPAMRGAVTRMQVAQFVYAVWTIGAWLPASDGAPLAALRTISLLLVMYYTVEFSRLIDPA
jgi:hypothetical protein